MKKILIRSCFVLFGFAFLAYQASALSIISVSDNTPKNNPCDKSVVPDDIYTDFRTALANFLNSDALKDIDEQIKNTSGSDKTAPIEVYVDDLDGFKKQYTEDTDGLNPPGTEADAENIYNSYTAYTYLTDTLKNGVQVIKVKFFCNQDLRIRTIDNDELSGWKLYEQIIHEFVHAKLYALLALNVDESNLPFRDHDDTDENDDQESFFQEAKRLLEKFIKELREKGLAVTSTKESVAIADLEVKEPNLLPTNPFYFLKEWQRGVQRLFTFNAVKKLNLELEIADQKAAEVKKIQEIAPENIKAVNKALGNYREAQNRLKEKFERLEETSQNPQVDKLLEKLTDRTVKHEKLIDEVVKKFENRAEIAGLAGEVKEKIEETAVTAAKKDEPANFSAKLEKALIESRGSELKHIRSLEIIDRLNQKAPEDLKQSLGRLKDDFSQKLESDVKAVLEKEKPEVVQRAVEELPGDILRRSLIIEDIRQQAEKRVAEVLEKAGAALEKSAEEEKNTALKAEEQIKNAETQIKKLEEKLAQAIDSSEVIKNLLSEARGNFEASKIAFQEEKYGEAFGQARSAEVLTRNGLRLLEKILDEKRPQSENLEEKIKELAVKIDKYEALVKSRFTEDSAPEVYELLKNARQHLDFARQAFSDNNFNDAKLHIGHVKNYLQDLSRLIETNIRGGESRIPVPAVVPTSSLKKPAVESQKRPESILPPRCDQLKRSLAELDELLKSEKISVSDYKIKYENIKKDLVVCEQKQSVVSPAPAPTPVKPVESSRQIVCTQDYNPVCGNDGKIYSNACFAKIAGVEIKSKGECQTEKPASVSPLPTQTVTPTVVSQTKTDDFLSVFVTIDDRGQFSPLTVKVKKGGKVTWVNKSQKSVWPASAIHPTHQLYPGFDALRGLNTGEQYSFVFEKVGSWQYHDHLNPSSIGRVEVFE